jgi:hypothetical protein
LKLSILNWNIDRKSLRIFSHGEPLSKYEQGQAGDPGLGPAFDWQRQTAWRSSHLRGYFLTSSRISDKSRAVIQSVGLGLSLPRVFVGEKHHERTKQKYRQSSLQQLQSRQH